MGDFKVSGAKLKRLGIKRRLPLKVTVVFLLLGTLWEFVVEPLLGVPEKALDYLYTLFSAAVIYWIVDQGLAALRGKEDALEASEGRLRSFIETSMAGIVVMDREGGIAFANQEASRVAGLEIEEIVGRRYDFPGWELADSAGNPFPPDDHPFVRIVSTGKPVCGAEYVFRRPDGGRVVLVSNGAPLRGPAGEIVGVVFSFFDVTERSKREALDRRKLSLAVDQSPVAVVVTDARGAVEYVNRSFSRMTGYSPEEMIGERGACPTDQSPETCEQVCRAIREGTEWRGEFRNRRKDGELYWESASLSPIRDDDGAVTNFFWLREDVTAQRAADERLKALVRALSESEERFRQIFEQNQEPIIIFRAGSGEITDANRAAVSLYGYTREELAAGGISLFASPQDRESLDRRIRGIGPDTGLAVDRMTHIRKDGTAIIVSVHGHSVHLQDGRVSYCTFRDITNRVRMEEEVRAKQAQLVHANRMASLGTIVSGVAHEINNPNNLTMFNAPMIKAAWEDAMPILEGHRRENGDFLLGGLPFSEMREIVPKLLSGVSDASLRIKNIVRELKDFARRDTNKLDCAVNLNEVVRSAAVILHHEINKGCDDFRIVYDESLPPVKGCAQQLEQVVVNLVLNSLQSLPGRDRGIRIETSFNAGLNAVEVRVADEGRGMPPEILQRISEPFFSTRTDSGGLGLGLSISFSIVKEHRGALKFQSAVGEGTTATILLPAHACAKGSDPGISVSVRST